MFLDIERCLKPSKLQTSGPNPDTPRTLSENISAISSGWNSKTAQMLD